MDTDTIKLTGLRSVLERLHADGALEEQVGDGTRHANLYETTPEKVLALRDLILSESKQEQNQPAKLQIEPLGPKAEDKEPHEGYKSALEKATKAMNQAEQTYAICQSKLGLDELPWRSHIGPFFGIMHKTHSE